jgi:predicted nucleic acid-binding protein
LRLAVDTNVLAYAEGVNEDRHRVAAVELLEKLPKDSTVVPVQVLAELFKVLLRRTSRSREEARAAILEWSDIFTLADTSPKIMLAAMDLATLHRIGIWDAIILAVAADSGCRLLLTEDMNEGFTWQGVTVVNPFAPIRHPLLDAVLRQDSSPNGEHTVGD